MTLDEFRKLLLTVIPDVYHFEAFKTDGKYIVWQEQGVNGFSGSNRRCQIVQYRWIFIPTTSLIRWWTV